MGLEFSVRTVQGQFSLVDGPGTFAVLREMIAGGWRSNLALGGDGLIYGVRGSPDYGSVFRIDEAGTSTTLHVFSGYGGLDGAYPNAPLASGSDGAMYGTTRYGGGTGGGGAGTVFRVTRDGTFASLHAFDWTDGSNPEQPLVLARNRALYGVARGGSTSAGTVFRIDGGMVTSFPILPFDVHSALVQGSDCALYGFADHWVDGRGSQGLVYRVFEPGHALPRDRLRAAAGSTFGDPRPQP